MSGRDFVRIYIKVRGFCSDGPGGYVQRRFGPEGLCPEGVMSGGDIVRRGWVRLPLVTAATTAVDHEKMTDQ